MGNELSKYSNKGFNSITDKPLGQWINNWALNNYTVIGKTPNEIDDANLKQTHTNTLKKRACCTRREKISIPIASVIGDKIVATSVPIDVFTSDQIKNQDTLSTLCKLDNNNESYAATRSDSGNPLATSTSCASFYKETRENILESRSRTYKPELVPVEQPEGQRVKTDPNGILFENIYGSNPDSSTISTEQTNAFIDYNCINNPFMICNPNNDEIKPEIRSKICNYNGKIINFDNPGINPLTFAQMTEIKCSSNLSNTYNRTLEKIEYCRNSVNIGSIISKNSTNGQVNIKQTCTKDLNAEEDKQLEADKKKFEDARIEKIKKDEEARKEQERARQATIDSENAKARQADLDAKARQAAIDAENASKAEKAAKEAAAKIAQEAAAKAAQEAAAKAQAEATAKEKAKSQTQISKGANIELKTIAKETGLPLPSKTSPIQSLKPSTNKSSKPSTNQSSKPPSNNMLLPIGGCVCFCCCFIIIIFIFMSSKKKK
jgi:hypothetical protein